MKTSQSACTKRYGKLMKNIGVSGGKVGIYDLPKGVYVITVSSGNEDTKVARFMK